MLVLGIYIKNVLLSAYLGCRGGGVGGGGGGGWQICPLITLEKISVFIE